MSLRFVLSVFAMLSLGAAFGFDAAAERPKPPRNLFGETAEAKAARVGWWQQGRFGMFIHFGLYAMPARGEWVRSREKISNAAYDEKYLPRFDPDLFDARAWARRAKEAGMKYMVLTAKHHEGFCMWDSATTDYKITKTPFGRDLVKEFVEACRAEGLGVGLYFSIIDWHHPDFLIDGGHPHRPSSMDDATYEKVNKGRDMAKYRAYMMAQMKELLTNYGRIDIMWFDFVSLGKYGKNWKMYESVDLIKAARQLQPWILVDSRLDLMDTEDGWDFVTPEQFKVTECPKWEGKNALWETCQTFSGHWGYSRDEETWKSAHQLIELLVHTVSFDGNLILNVGPTARGEFDDRACNRLDAIGKWMHVNARSIYGCGAAPAEFTPPAGTLLTYNKKSNRLYIHLCDYPMGELPFAFADRVKYAQFLHDGSEVFVKPGARIRHSQSGEMKYPDVFSLPIRKPNVEIPVIEIFL